MSGVRLWMLLLLFPLAGCLATDPSGDGSMPPAGPAWSDERLTPPDQVASEVSIAIDPADADHVMAAANAGGGFDVYETHGDGWTTTRLTPDGLFGAAGARFTGLSDPVVAFHPDGTPYIAGLAIIPGSAVFVATPDPWRATIVWESEIAATFNDKEWLGIHPETGTFIMAWQREPALDQLRGIEQQTGGALDLDAGLIVVSRSSDGEQWSVPETVSGDSVHNNGTQVAFTPDGRVHMIWVDYEAPGLVHVASDDDGQTWSDPQPVANLSIVGSFEHYSRMHTLPALAAGPDGLLYAIWHDDRHGDADILVAAGDGATWQTMRVPDDPEGSGVIQFYPWGAVDGDGTLHVTYYSAVHAPDHPRFVYRHIPYHPATGWGEPTDISNTTFTAFGPGDEARGLGDYTGTAARGGTVWAAWADGRGESSAVHAGML